MNCRGIKDHKPITIDACGLHLRAAKVEFEREYCRRLLLETRYNIAAAARKAGVPYRTFYRHIDTLDLKGDANE